MNSTQSTFKLDFLRHIYPGFSVEYVAFKQLYDSISGEEIVAFKQLYDSISGEEIEVPLHPTADHSEKPDSVIDFQQT